MKVLVVSGIWPPDQGGPASHAPELAAWLLARGHGVEVVTTADRQPAPAAYRVRWVSRRIPVGMRHVATVTEITRRAWAADVVYATSMHGRAAAASVLARRPLVVKLVADAAYERARRFALYTGDLEGFEHEAHGLRVEALRRARDATVGRADHVVCPSAYLADLAVAWGVPTERVTVLPNPAPSVPDLPSREALRAELGLTGPALAFAGRITAQKDLDVALDAVASLPGVTLRLLGDGPDRARLERRAADLGLNGRVRFLGAGSRLDVLRLFRAADASLLSSAWENFPHTVVEALAVGTPVIATAVGGVAEVVRDGENGLLVPPGDPRALAAAIARFVGDAALQERLRGNAAASVDDLRTDRVYGRLEAILERAAG